MTTELRATPGEQEILPLELSPLEKQRQGIASLLRRLGYDNYRAQQLAENTTFLSEFIPGFGDVQGMREGKYIFDEGDRVLGAGIMGLSALPFIPVGRMVRNLRNKGNLNVTPTQAFRTRTGESELEQAEDFRDYARNISLEDAATVGRPNVETLLEREVIKFASDTASDLNKAYPVKNILKEMESKLPDAAKGGFKRQVDEFVPPELMKTKATLQEVLDNIGKNKPTIKEMESQFDLGDVGASMGSRYSMYLPNIPKVEEPARTIPEGMETAPLLNYTERSFAADYPRYGRLFEDPGHSEVGTGLLPEFTRDSFDPNTANRIFTTRSALYEQDGKKILVGAEGQSGMYRMDTSMKILPRDKLPQGIRGEQNSIANKIRRGQDLDELLTSPEIQKSVKDSGNSLDELKELIDEQATELDMLGDNIIESFGLPSDYPLFTGRAAVPEANIDYPPLVDKTGRRYEPVELDRINEMEYLALDDNVSKFASKIERLIIGGDKGIDAPMIKDWFPMHMKTVLNEAVEKGADVVRFPINDYAVANQTGDVLVPPRARDIDFDDSLRGEGSLYPGETAKALAKDYKKFTEKGIKRIEGEYGIKLNAKVIDDENYNEFLEIEMTPELKEIFKTLVFNRGGAVRKPLMNLKY
jgi:hypothetical protein